MYLPFLKLQELVTFYRSRPKNPLLGHVTLGILEKPYIYDYKYMI